MTALDLDRLEALADAATPGPWETRCEGPGEPTYVCHDSEAVIYLGWEETAAEFHPADAAFIAETGPDVVKELVRQLREARAGQADAWDEGFDEGHRAARSLPHTTNPYRSNDA